MNGYMSTPLLATKLYIPPPRPKAVLRPRLIERLNEGLRGKLTSSLPLLASVKPRWSANGLPVASDRSAWLSLDEGITISSASWLPRCGFADDCRRDRRWRVGRAPIAPVAIHRIAF